MPAATAPPRDPRAVLTDPAHRRLMILGSPGSGKTTLMKALDSGVSRRQWPELGSAVPVYARLRAYADAGEEADLWNWLAARLEADFGLRHAAALLDALHRDGQLLLLLDGLDEIGEAAARWLPARIGWRLPWRGMARTVVSSALVVGGWLLFILFEQAPLNAQPLIAWAGLIVIGLTGGVATALVWWPWDWLARRAGGWSAEAGAVPTVIRGLLRPPGLSDAADPSGGWMRRAIAGLVRFLGRAVLWSGSILLLPIALLVTYTSLSRHGWNTSGVAYAPDGQRLATASYDDTARLWDADTGAELRRLDRHRSNVNAVTFSPDGGRVLLGYKDGSVRVWDAQTGAPIRIIAAFWTPATWNAWDLVVFAFLVILLVYVPTVKWFEKGRWLYLRRPNAYLWLYDLPGIEHYIPVDTTRDKRR